MGKIIAVSLGGALGSTARYLLALLVERSGPANFPVGTLLANLIGCLFIGLFWSLFDRFHLTTELRLLLFTGILGGFTTFSTFCRETTQFFKAGEPLLGISYLAISNVGGITMVFVGFWLAHRLLH
ncbi:MAG: fluoride efflux transporter CrcB [Thermodesulfobacteriota bacterium]